MNPAIKFAHVHVYLIKSLRRRQSYKNEVPALFDQRPVHKGDFFVARPNPLMQFLLRRNCEKPAAILERFYTVMYKIYSQEIPQQLPGLLALPSPFPRFTITTQVNWHSWRALRVTGLFRPVTQSFLENRRYFRFSPKLDSGMILSLASYKPFFSSFCHFCPARASFVKLAN